MSEAFKIIIIMMACTASYAGTIDPSTPDEKYRKYGSEHECVVKISGIYANEKENHNFSASAVVMSPHWILTAAHVVQEASNVRIKIGKKEYDIEKIIVNKDFESDNLGYGDIALGYCREDFGISIYPKLYDKKDEVGKVVGICGYGMTGTFSTGIIKSDGEKRAGSNIVDRIDRNCLVCSIDGGRKTGLEFMIGSGDSGGGLFLEGKLAGINSFVMAADKKPNSDYGDECAHTRVSDYIDWIEINTKNAD